MGEIAQESEKLSQPSEKKFKRIVIFDFLRGCAMIGVLGFHMLNVAYDYEAVLDNDPPIVFYLTVAVLAFLGSFYTMFIVISAISNTFAVEKKWNQLIAANLSPADAAASIRGQQVFRGGLLVFFGYFSESILNKLVLGVLVPEPWEEIEDGMLSAIQHSQILSTIGFGVIITSIIYLQLKKNGKTQQEIQKILMICMLFVLFVRPAITPIHNLITEWMGSDISAGENILKILLSPFYVGYFPLFPNLALSFFGVMIGMELTQDKIEDSTLKKLTQWSLFFFVCGLIWLFAFDDGYMNNLWIATAGSLMLITILLVLVERRGKGTKFAHKTLIFRRFGNVTLSLWCLQWVMVFPLKLMDKFVNLIDGTNLTFLEGRIWNTQMTGWETLVMFIAVTFFWQILLLLWEKANFAYSLEWLMAKGLRKQQTSSAKTDMNAMLYNVVSIIPEEAGTNPNKTWKYFLLYFLYNVGFLVSLFM